MSGETRLVLIRHGESAAQAGSFIGGHQGCKGLSDLGRRQVDALRRRLERTGEIDGVSALYSSVLPRAIETAEILRPALGDLDTYQDCDLCEGHPGEADGITWEEWRDKYSEQVYDKGPYVPWSPGGESWADLVNRAGRRLTQVANEHPDETVVVACHGGIIDASLRVFGHVPLDTHWRTHIDNASMTEWALRDYEGRKPGRQWTLVRFNDAAHLHDVTN